MRCGPERRIRKRREFQAIQSQGRRVVSEHFVFVVAHAAQGESPPRLGITVTRRVGNAVRRNRIKRIVRAAFREGSGLLPTGFDLVVICRRDHPDLSSKDVLRQFRALEKKLKKAMDMLERPSEATMRATPSPPPSRS